MICGFPEIGRFGVSYNKKKITVLGVYYWRLIIKGCFIRDYYRVVGDTRSLDCNILWFTWQFSITEALMPKDTV